MKRALETSEFISKKKGNLPIHVIEEIREVNVGDLEKTPSEKMKNAWILYFEIARILVFRDPRTKIPKWRKYD